MSALSFANQDLDSDSGFNSHSDSFYISHSDSFSYFDSFSSSTRYSDLYSYSDTLSVTYNISMEEEAARSIRTLQEPNVRVLRGLTPSELRICFGTFQGLCCSIWIRRCEASRITLSAGAALQDEQEGVLQRETEVQGFANPYGDDCDAAMLSITIRL